MRTTDKNAIVRIAHRIFAYWNTPSSRFLFYFYKPSITFYFWLCSSSPLYLLHYPPVTVTVSSKNIARVRTFPQSIASSQYARGSVSESSNLNIPTKKKNSPPKNPLLSPILTFQVILWQCLPIKAIGQPLPWLNTSASHQWSLHSFPQLTSETSATTIFCVAEPRAVGLSCFVPSVTIASAQTIAVACFPPTLI